MASSLDSVHSSPVDSADTSAFDPLSEPGSKCFLSIQQKEWSREDPESAFNSMMPKWKTANFSFLYYTETEADKQAEDLFSVLDKNCFIHWAMGVPRRMAKALGGDDSLRGAAAAGAGEACDFLSQSGCSSPVLADCSSVASIPSGASSVNGPGVC